MKIHQANFNYSVIGYMKRVMLMQNKKNSYTGFNGIEAKQKHGTI